LTTTAYSDDKDKKKPWVYRHDFEEQDLILSGSEMKGLKEKDANGHGEISLAEFLGKSC